MFSSDCKQIIIIASLTRARESNHLAFTTSLTTLRRVSAAVFYLVELVGDRLPHLAPFRAGRFFRFKLQPHVLVDCVGLEPTLQGYLTPLAIASMDLHRPHGYRCLLVNSPIRFTASRMTSLCCLALLRRTACSMLHEHVARSNVY